MQDNGLSAREIFLQNHFLRLVDKINPYVKIIIDDITRCCYQDGRKESNEKLTAFNNCKACKLFFLITGSITQAQISHWVAKIMSRFFQRMSLSQYKIYRDD